MSGVTLECGDLSPLWYWGVVDAEIRCTNAVIPTRRDTPRRTIKKWLAPTFLSGGQTTLLLG